MFLIGRVFRQRQVDERAATEDLGATLRDIGRRIRRRDVTGAVRLGGAEERVGTEHDGYDHVQREHRSALPEAGDRWHPVALAVQFFLFFCVDGRCLTGMLGRAR